MAEEGNHRRNADTDTDGMGGDWTWAQVVRDPT